MSTFEHLWQLLVSHGVVPDERAEAERYWNTYNLDQQRAIYSKIRDKIRNGKFVNYHPVIAIHDNVPKLKTLTMSRYYDIYHDSRPTDGWRMVNPTGQQVIYYKYV